MPGLTVVATGSRLSKAREHLAGVKDWAAGIDAQGEALVAEFNRIDDRIAGAALDPDAVPVLNRC